jgi:hypothetical protein
MVDLTFFCDNLPAAHAIGKNHPDYTSADTDREWNRTADEHRRKPFGAPLCTRLDVLRPGICGACPHQGKIHSPYSLGVDPNGPPPAPDELPRFYRRNNGWIERAVPSKRPKGADEYEWARLIEGDITGVGVSASGDKKRLHFTYTCGRHVRAVAVDETEIVFDLNRLKVMFALRGITLNFDNSLPFGRLIMAWIEKLRHSSQREALPAIGWAKSNGDYVGFSIGGVCYLADGTKEQVASDAEALRDRVPRGKLEVWQEAAALSCGHPVTEIAIAIGFAAPILEFTGEAGLCISIVGKTATGKTAAFRAAQSIWSRPRSTMFSLDDTENYVHIRVGQAPGLPAYWDENVITKERVQKVVGFVHKVTQGRDKGRAMADTGTRQSGEWNTLVAMSSNRSVLDLVASDNNETDAAMLRVFELNLERTMPSNIINAASILARCEDNYGTAGAIYAEYIAANVEAIRTALGKIKGWVVAKVGGMRSDERFYVAGICSVIVGAAIARQLKLLDFNVLAIRDELVSTLLRLRSEREVAIPVHNDRLMAIEVIDAYCNYHMQDGLVTKYLRPAGRHELERGFEISNTAGFHKSPTPAYQIALKEALLRINRDHWRDWCATTRRSSRALVKLFINEFSALPEERGAMGAGCHFSTPRARYIEVPLASPDLAHWIDGYLPKAIATNVTPLRPVR